MTLDEAIAHAREVSKSFDYKTHCKECAKEHKQLAEWLEELKKLKSSTVPYYDGFKEGKQVGYNKAIDDFLEKIQWEYLNSCGLKQREIEFLIAVSSQVAEQLKAGGENEQSDCAV